MISLICGILKNDTNELTYKTEIDSDIENKGERWEEGQINQQEFGINIYTVHLNKVDDNQQGPIVQHRELYSILCRKRIEKEQIYVCISLNPFAIYA